MAETEGRDNANAADKHMYYGIHCAAASSWGDEGAARLCELVMACNSGLAQQIQDNQTELMDVLELKDLEKPVDDLGITLPFLAVYYDRPKMLEYLRKRGVDITKPCDPMEWGNPMFYAIYFKRVNLIFDLDILGCSVREPCDSLKTLPLTHAQRLDDPFVIKMIYYAFGKEQRASTMVCKHFWRIKYRRIYLYKINVGIPLLMRAGRGLIARQRARKIRNARNKAIRKAQRSVRREEKLANGDDLDSDDESTIEDADLLGYQL